MGESYILKAPSSGSLDFGSAITLSGDFRIKIENVSFLDNSADFNSVFGTGTASTNFLIYRRDGTNNQWQFRASGNTTNFTTGSLPTRSIRGKFEFERVGTTGYIRYRDSEITATISSSDFTLDTIGLINNALGADIQFGNIEIEESGTITHSYDFDNAVKTGVVISDSVGTNDLTGSGFTSSNWKQVFNYNPVQSAFTALPDGTQGQNPSGGWTCTGLDKLADGSWLVGNDGRSDSSDTTQTPSIVNLSEDMTTIIAEYDMTPIVGAFTLQGVAVDTDGTWWAASRTADLLIHLTSSGALIDSWSITDINGIALDTDRGGLWVVTVPDNSSGTNLRFWDFTTETFDSQYEINASGIDYQDHIHYRDDYLYLTHGSNGINGNVSVFDATEQVRVDLYTNLTGAQAIEGVYIDGTNMYITNDGGFHTEADPAISAIITYDLGVQQSNEIGGDSNVVITPSASFDINRSYSFSGQIPVDLLPTSNFLLNRNYSTTGQITYSVIPESTFEIKKSYNIDGSVNLSFIVESETQKNINVVLDGESFVDITPSSSFQFGADNIIDGSINLGLNPESSFVFNKSYILNGNVDISIAPDSETQTTKNYTVSGKSEVSFSIEGDFEFDGQNLINGDVIISALPNAEMVLDRVKVIKNPIFTISVEDDFIVLNVEPY